MTISINRDQLRFTIDYGSGIVVVDALPAAPYSRRHIAGALNLVIDDVDEQALRLLPEKGTSIVTYSTDASCGRGESLAEML
jgi:rhodanese-related sulfurtransferase